MALQHVTPMIHVPDVSAAVDWYRLIGFSVLDTFVDQQDGTTFALLAFGNSQIMLNAGGRVSGDDRREVDLYVRTDDVDTLYQKLSSRVEIRQGVENTFYGTREFVVRDLNGFWLTFGQQLPTEPN